MPHGRDVGWWNDRGAGRARRRLGDDSGRLDNPKDIEQARAGSHGVAEARNEAGHRRAGLDKPETMLSAYALLNRIRLSSSDAVLAQAENLVRRIAEQYFSSNISLEEIRAMTQSLEGDPLKSFGETCRAELQSIRAAG